MGISVPQWGVRARPRALEVKSLNHWTTRKIPIYFFLASLGLCCGAWASLQWPTTGSRVHGLSGYGTWAWLWPCSTWDPWPGIEPVSPALEGGFLTTKSPGEISSSVQSLFATLWTAACQASLSIHHQLPELAQTHVHHISDVIQPSHPLSSPSLPTFTLSQQ